MLNNLLQMHLKLFLEEQEKIQKQQQKLVTKLLTKLQKSQRFHHRIIQKQLQMKNKILDLIEKYLQKDIYSIKKTDSY